jgi:hypothetical protein
MLFRKCHPSKRESAQRAYYIMNVNISRCKTVIRSPDVVVDLCTVSVLYQRLALRRNYTDGIQFRNIRFTFTKINRSANLKHKKHISRMYSFDICSIFCYCVAAVLLFLCVPI